MVVNTALPMCRVEQDLSIVMRFIIGHSEEAQAEALINREIAIHNGFIRLPVTVGACQLWVVRLPSPHISSLVGLLAFCRVVCAFDCVRRTHRDIYISTCICTSDINMYKRYRCFSALCARRRHT